jgi:uncharacterized protein (DUF58 family)
MRFARHTRPRRTFRFTREGKLFLAMTAGVGLAAVNTGNNLMYLVLGLMLSTLLVSGILSEQALRKVRVARRLPRRAFEGQACFVDIALENHKRRLSSHALVVRDGDGPDAGEARFLRVGPGQSQTRAYALVPRRRGELELGELRVWTAYPFGLVEKGRRVPMRDTLLVYPGLVPVADLPPPRAAEPHEAVMEAAGAGSEVAGVRDYVAGDEARVIHWRRTASLGRLVVRERHRDAVARCVLHLEEPEGRSSADEARDEGFERQVRRVASQALLALSRGQAVQVRTPSGSSPTLRPGAAPDPILRYLALLGPGP